MVGETGGDSDVVPSRCGAQIPFAGVAFSTWSAAFAVGALLHLWPGASTDWTFGPVVAVAAFAVLLRPASPPRLIVLIGLVLVEAVLRLPDLSNHHMFVATLALALVPWWLVTAWRRPEVAHDPAALYVRVGPYLRMGFVVAWTAAAFAKLNHGFFDTARTCAVWMLESIPAVAVPGGLAPIIVAAAVATELAVPTLLLFHRTRPYAVVIGLGFHTLSALAGHASYSGFAWSFYLLFLPPGAIARAVACTRLTMPERVQRAATYAAAAPWWNALPAGLAWWLGWHLLPDMIAGPVRRWGDALLFTAWALAWAVLLWKVRRHWIPAPESAPRAGLRVRNGVLVLGLVLLAASAASPYLGLKTRSSLTMFSNLRTEPGHWNHLVVPESTRIFGWQDGEVRYLGSDDPALDAAVDRVDARHTVLLDLRMIVSKFPGATVRYTLDGIERIAQPVAGDPVLGQPIPLPQRLLAAMRPFPAAGNCQQ